MATAAAFWPCFIMFHCFSGISRLTIIHLIHLSALGLCICLMLSCSPHLQASYACCTASAHQKRGWENKHHMRWTIHGPVMSLSCGKLLSILSFIYSIFICHESTWLTWLQAVPTLEACWDFGNKLSCAESVAAGGKSSFQVGKGSRRNGGRGFGGLLRRYLED